MCIFSAFVCGLISSADYIQVDTADTREPRWYVSRHNSLRLSIFGRSSGV